MTTTRTFAVAAVSSSVLALGLLASAGSAEAATITNSDAKVYEILVIEGDQERRYTVEPDQSVTDICPSACTLALSEDAEFLEIAVADDLLIEEGQVYLLDPQSADGDIPPEANDVPPQEQFEPGLEPQQGQER